jgi:hypothetical protein
VLIYKIAGVITCKSVFVLSKQKMKIGLKPPDDEN